MYLHNFIGIPLNLSLDNISSLLTGAALFAMICESLHHFIQTLSSGFIFDVGLIVFFVVKYCDGVSNEDNNYVVFFQSFIAIIFLYFCYGQNQKCSVCVF